MHGLPGTGVQLAQEPAPARRGRLPRVGAGSSEFGRTDFQGRLNSYRLQTASSFSAELRLYSGATIDVPALFISGKSD
jgi:hypothetical protein